MLRIDDYANAAYLRLSDHQIVATREVTESVLVDLDDQGAAVGVEVLSLTAEIPLEQLLTEYGLQGEALDPLLELRHYPAPLVV